MKNNILKSVILSMFLILLSCQETVVTNIVHKDGSVTRRIEIRDDEGKTFKSDMYAVPFDSTWSITDTFELKVKSDEKKGDTTWIRRAEKLFKSVDEINQLYANDSGPNRIFDRKAGFSKKFRWFSTMYTFSENIEKTFHYGYPIGQFLNEKELEYYYMPEDMLSERRNSADSISVKLMEDSLKIKSDKWIVKCLISEWKEEFIKLSENKGKAESNRKFLDERDSMISSVVEKLEQDTASRNFDSTVVSTMVLIFGQDMYLKNKVEIDSAVSIIEERFESANSFTGYTMRNKMPGTLTATNGYHDTNGELLWPVKMEYFMTEPYRMWAESKIINTWAWIVSALFVLFVLMGLLVWSLRKKHA